MAAVAILILFPLATVGLVTALSSRASTDHPAAIATTATTVPTTIAATTTTLPCPGTFDRNCYEQIATAHPSVLLRGLEADPAMADCIAPAVLSYLSDDDLVSVVGTIEHHQAITDTSNLGIALNTADYQGYNYCRYAGD